MFLSAVIVVGMIWLAFKLARSETRRPRGGGRGGDGEGGGGGD